MPSAIEWTDETWNPVVGCDQVSPGCAHCYAKELHDMRHRAYQAGKLRNLPQYAQPFEVVQLMPDRVDAPLHWRKPRRVFVNSMADLFHDDVPFDFIDRVFAVMALADRHTFQVLTKRPTRMLEYFSDPWQWAKVEGTAQAIYEAQTGEDPSMWLAVHGPLGNVWLGVSVENQRWANERIPLLLQTPAAVRFLSCEPLLGPIDLTRLRPKGSTWLDCLDGREHIGRGVFDGDERVDWVIVGGESGPDRRECKVGWIEDVVAQCEFAGVPCFVKQDAHRYPGQQGRLPDDVWAVKQFPQVRLTQEAS